jgi:hypothetical protein
VSTVDLHSEIAPHMCTGAPHGLGPFADTEIAPRSWRDQEDWPAPPLDRPV